MKERTQYRNNAFISRKVRTMGCNSSKKLYEWTRHLPISSSMGQISGFNLSIPT